MSLPPTFTELFNRLNRDLSAGIARENPMKRPEFKQRLNELLRTRLPLAILEDGRIEHCGSNNGEATYEIDNAFHYSQGNEHHIIIVEARVNKVEVADGNWTVSYESTTKRKPANKNLKEQLLNQAETVFNHILCNPTSREIHVEVWLVSSSATQKQDHLRKGKLTVFVFHLKSNR